MTTEAPSKSSFGGVFGRQPGPRTNSNRKGRGNDAIAPRIAAKLASEGSRMRSSPIPSSSSPALGEGSPTLTLQINYGRALYNDPGATLSDLRESVRTFEKIEPTARRVLGSAHPDVLDAEQSLRTARAALADFETPP